MADPRLGIAKSFDDIGHCLGSVPDRQPASQEQFAARKNQGGKHLCPHCQK